MTEYLVGTGGWAYFNYPNKTSLSEYSKNLNFVEVNFTFYEYPSLRTVDRWRRSVPKNFIFAVRCNMELTHQIGLKPTEEAYSAFDRMISICKHLNAAFLVLETSKSYVLNNPNINDAEKFLSSIKSKDVQLVWEIRSPITKRLADLMQTLDIIQCIDVSRQEISQESDIIYSRIFGKGKQNVYQLDDEELMEIDHKILASRAKTAVLTFHGVRMDSDATRFRNYISEGRFLPATPFTGMNSIRHAIAEDCDFPIDKKHLLEQQGWKVIDLTRDKRIHLSTLVQTIPDRVYQNTSDLLKTIEQKWIASL